MPNYRAESTRCTALTRSGKFCDERKTLPDAPFPICIEHAALLLRYLKSYMPNAMDDRIILMGQAAVEERERLAPVRERRERESVVYYVQVGQHIKVGYTSDLPSRMRAYPPMRRLLATEPGGPVLEKQRHAQFANDLRHGNEWFHPSPALLAHINRLRQAAA